MRPRRSQYKPNRIVVASIAVCCSFALYALFLKVQRLIELSEWDRSAKSEAVVASVVYLNSSFSGDSATLKFLIHSQSDFPSDFHCETRNSKRRLISKMKTEVIGPSRILLGTCESLEHPFYVTLSNKDFSASLDPLLIVPRRRSVVCLSLALLYEDVDSLRALLDHYEDQADLVEIYVSSWHEKALKEAERREKVSIVWWPLFSSFRQFPRQGKLSLDEDSYEQSLASSFGDCWLRHAPFADALTLVDLTGMRFSTTNRRKNTRLGETVSLKKLRGSEWRSRTLRTARVAKTSNVSLTVVEVCGGDAATKEEEDKTRRQTNSLILRRTPATSIGKSSYREAIERCTSFKGHSLRRRKMMQRKKVDGSILDDPCLIKMKRDGFRCRVASQTIKRMFSGDTKVNVVLKRSMLRFYDGCN